MLAAQGVCDRLEVPSVAIERCVVAGHQREIDAGKVVRVSGLSSANVHWIAGHRTTYGGTFRSLPALRLGDVQLQHRYSLQVLLDFLRRSVLHGSEYLRAILCQKTRQDQADSTARTSDQNGFSRKIRYWNRIEIENFACIHFQIASIIGQAN